jgi:hypothetical protein
VSEGHESQKENLAPYALGALDESQARELEAHLEDCRHCREELAWLRPAVDVLALSAPPVRPPARIRRELASRARAEAADATRAEEAAGRVVGIPLRPALGLAAVLAVLLAGVIGFVAGDEPGSRTTTDALQASSDTPPGAHGELVIADGTATIQLHDLPPVRGGDVYQAWIRRGELIEPSTVFVPDRGGDAYAAIPALEEADEIMVTREPMGGSRKPSTAPIFRATPS